MGTEKRCETCDKTTVKIKLPDDDTIVSSLLLPCLHTFCQNCLQAQLGSGSSLQCATCGQVHVLAKGLESLVPNLTIGRQRAATPESICPDHPDTKREEGMYCNTCQAITCSRFACVNKLHKGHDICSFDEISAEMSGVRARITTAIEQVNNTAVPTLESAAALVSKNHEDKLRQIENTREKVRAAGLQLVEVVNKVVAGELERIDNYQMMIGATCGKRTRELTNQQTAVSHAISYGSRLATDGTDEDVKTLSATVVQALQHIRDRPISSRPPALGQVRYEESEESENVEKALVDLMGELSIVHIGGRFSTSNVPKGPDGVVRTAPNAANYMIVTTRTADGKQLRGAGGDCLTAEFAAIPEEGGERPEVKVDDNMDGTYKLTYQLPKDGRYQLKVAVNGDSIVDSPFEIAASSSQWQLDPQRCGAGVSLTEEHRKVTKNTLGHASVLGTSGWESGVHSWTFKISQKQNCYAGVGFQNDVALQWRGSKSPASVWCFSTNGYKYSDYGVEAIILGQDGSDVKMTLDCDQHTLTMLNLSGGSKEVITGLPDGMLYPWFHLYYIKTNIQIISVE